MANSLLSNSYYDAMNDQMLYEQMRAVKAQQNAMRDHYNQAGLSSGLLGAPQQPAAEPQPNKVLLLCD